MTSCRAEPVQAKLPASDGAHLAAGATRGVLIVVGRGIVVAGCTLEVDVVGATVAGTDVVDMDVDVVEIVAEGIGGEKLRTLVEPAHDDATATAAHAPISGCHRDLGLDGVVTMSAGASSRRPRIRYALLVVLLVAAGACSSTGHVVRTSPSTSTPPQSSTTLPPPTVPSTTTTSTTPKATATGPPAFAYTVTTLTATDVPSTWRPGCPVSPSQLRSIHMTYWGFDSLPHPGVMIVNELVVNDVVTIFRTLYQQRFPIFQMVPQDSFEGNDDAAAAANDTSGFNCRYAVTSPPSQSWSVHAFGEAIDVNDVQNPYVNGSTIIPPAGGAYLNRANVRPGMAVRGGILVNAFASVGWQWGGRWSPGTDYQHFSKTGG